MVEKEFLLPKVPFLNLYLEIRTLRKQCILDVNT